MMKTKILIIQLILFLGAFQAIAQPCDLLAEVFSTSCAPKGGVTIHVSGGTPSYISADLNEIEPGVFESEEILDPGTYTYTIQDSEGCQTDVTFTIGECCGFSATVISTSCAPKGGVTIQVTGGTPGYISADLNEIDPGIFESEDILDPGTYTYTFEDSEGCQTDVTFTIGECCGFSAAVISTSCAPKGGVTIHVTGGTPGYSSADLNEIEPGIFESEDILDPGTYTYTFEDRAGCQTDVTFTIGECCGFSAEVFSISCAPKGGVTIHVTGGTPGYSSADLNEIEPGVFESEDILDPGTYTYTFEDSEGCQTDVTFTIGECCGFSAAVISTSCAPKGGVTIQVTGGTPGYSSADLNEIEPGIFESEDILDPGTYTYTFEDSEGCQTDVTFTIVDECCYFSAAAISTSCAPKGGVTIQVTGGTPGYISYDLNEIEPGIFESEEALDLGTYTYTFEDSNGCQTDVTFTIVDECCGFSAAVISTSCAPDGAVTIRVRGGTPGYISYDMNEIDPGIFESEEGLDPGIYTYIFYDSEGCETDVTFTILDGPVAEVQSVSCGSTGGVTIQVTGGTPGYFSADMNEIDPGIFESEEDLDPGTYTYTFEDSNGCTDNVTFIIPEEVLKAEASSEIGCGDVQVVVTGGTPPYTSNFDGQQNTDGIFNFSLELGEYELSFTDQNGCEVTTFLEGAELADCSDFESISAGLLADGTVVGTVVSSSSPIIVFSGVKATISTRIDGGCAPDRLIIEVNDEIVVDQIAGTGVNNLCGSGNQIEEGSFCVDICDKVEITIFLPILCSTCGGNSGNTFLFEVTDCEISEDCENEFGGNGEESSKRSVNNDRRNSEEDLTPSIEIYPNPTSEILNISNLNNRNQLSVLRIINNAGITLISKDISDQNQVMLDINSIPSGIYFVEIRNENGYSIVEKFVKN